MLTCIYLSRNNHGTPVPHTALGQNSVGELPDCFGWSLQNRKLHAARMAERNVHRPRREIVMFMEVGRDAARHLPGPGVVHVDKGSHTG